MPPLSVSHLLLLRCAWPRLWSQPWRGLNRRIRSRRGAAGPSLCCFRCGWGAHYKAPGRRCWHAAAASQTLEG